MNLHQKILDNKKQLVFFEVVPPPISSSLKPTLESLIKMFELIPIDAINIPEAIDNGNSNQKKYQALDLASEIKKQVKKNIPIVLNQPTVYEAWSKQKKILMKISRKIDIDTLILVGGKNSNRKYCGPSVNETAQLINSELMSDGLKFLLGGIMIQTRKNEVQRMMGKIRAGVSFFTSQLVVDEQPIQELLSLYAKTCRDNHCLSKRIFLSFAPILSKSDLILIKNLRIGMPEKTIKYLFNGWLGVGWRSIDLACQTLSAILKYNKQKNLNIPLGLNIEYIMRGNFELSYLMAKKLIKIYKSYY